MSSTSPRQRVHPVTSSRPPTPSSSQSTVTPPLSTSHSQYYSPDSASLPVTPAVRSGRRQSRYPELGRVPLHRRGTSRTYERLEDLLREAGYKETRVFTPEAERIASKTEETLHDGTRNRSLRGVGSVVGFITGLMPGGPTLNRSPSLCDESTKSREGVLPRSSSAAYGQRSSPPASPIPKHLRRSRPSTPSSAEYAGSTPKVSYQCPKLKQPRPHVPHALYSYSNDSNSSLRSQQRLHHAPSLSSRTAWKNGNTSPSRSALPHKPSEPVLQPQPSRAHAYLRHMASVSSMPPRASSTPAHQHNLNDDGLTSQRRGNGEGDQVSRPPLPRTWLETVARAVMFGGVGYVGGPPEQHVEDADGRGRNAVCQMLRPPEFMSQMSGRRAGRSESEVSRTRVMCHSAPSSRPSSRSRDRGDSVETKRPHGKAPRKGAAPNVPSLARTRVEGESSEWRAAARTDNLKAQVQHPAHRFRAGWGADGGDNSGSADELSDDDEGELDLSQILVPPKRQNSIRSLRKHLSEFNGEPSRRRASGLRVASSAVDRTDYGHWDGYREQPTNSWTWTKQPARRESLEEDDNRPFSPHFLDKSSKRSTTSARRAGLPTLWS